MADSKISALPASTTPLAGTEVVPLVQSGTTKQVSVANLTAGRSVSMSKLTASIPSGTDYHEMLADGLLNWGANGYLVTSFNAKTVTGTPGIYIGYNSSTKGGIIGPAAVGGAPNQGMEVWAFDNVSAFQQVGTFSAVAAKAGLTLNIGNFVPPATKGIDYSANTPAAGMTSQLLNWYEEGTWTGTLKGSVSDPTTPVTATGYYVRIGRQVSFQIYFNSVNTTGASGDVSISGLPFTNTAQSPSIVTVASYDTITWTGQLIGSVNAGTTTISFLGMSSAAAWSAATHNAGAGRFLIVSGAYQL